MLSQTRQARIADQQAAARSAYTLAIREKFAAQVPREYRAHGISELFEGTRDWGGTLSRDDALALARYLKRPTRFLLLVGPTGTGKSTAAYAISEHLVGTLEQPGRFVSATAMLTSFSFGHEGRSAADVLADYSDAPILVIDDLGSGNDGMSDHQKRSLWSLIDARWANGRHTIITSNMSIKRTRDGDGLRELLGESAWDRVGDSLTLATFDGRSFRGER